MGYFGFHISRALLSGVQFPISLQRSLLNFLLRQQKMERLGDCIGTFSKLRCQISHAYYHIPGWVTFMHALPISRNLVSQRTQILLFLPLGTFGSCLVGIKNPHTDCRDPNSRND